uniref:Uncharacterized protein n=1 Tax=Setaria italica TaxID=4555 RepID=K3ZC06_SETIT
MYPHYYYPNKVDIEPDESFREGLITCITKMVDNVKVQDQIIQELQQYQDGDRTFGKEIAKRQWKNKHFDPAKKRKQEQRPCEKIVANVLEDQDNEWIIGSEPNANSEQEQEPSRAQAATQPKRRGVQLQQQGDRKRKS